MYIKKTTHRHREKMTMFKPKTEVRPANTLILDFKSSELTKNKLLLFKSPSQARRRQINTDTHLALSMLHMEGIYKVRNKKSG